MEAVEQNKSSPV